jgi:hypothetical protein
VPKEKWKGKRGELLLINAATDRELEDFTHRDAAMQGRATVLVGAASLVGAIKLGQGFDWLVFVNLSLSFLAAVCGVVVFFPRSGHAPNPRQMWTAIYSGVSDEEALHNMIRVKLDELDSDERSLDRRSGWAKAGFVLLAASVLVTAVGSFIPVDDNSKALQTSSVSIHG